MSHSHEHTEIEANSPRRQNQLQVLKTVFAINAMMAYGLRLSRLKK